MTPISLSLQRAALVAVLVALTLASAGGLAQGPAPAPQASPPAPASAPAGPAPEPQSAPSPPAAPGPQAGFDYAGQREAIFDAFYKTGLDTSAPYAVSNLSIVKDNMTILLKQGTLFLMKPIAGEVTGAAFLGDGEASMTPPNRTERYMLKKHSGAETLREKFSEAVFRFSDGTDRMLRASAKPDPAGAARADAAEKVLRDRNGWLDGERSLALELQFLENRISGLKGQDFFVANLSTAAHDWLTYRYNPQRINEHLLFTTETMGGGGRRYIVPWTEWHKMTDYAATGHYHLLPNRDGPRSIAVRHTDMLIDLPDTKAVRWRARMEIEPLLDNLRCLRFDLVNNADFLARWYDDKFYPARLKSVKTAQGDALSHMHRKDQAIVLLPEPTRAGNRLTLEFEGDAEMVYQLTAESFGLLQVPWYPQYGYLGGRRTFRWEVRVPQPLVITGSGRLVREFELKESKQNGAEFRSDDPVTFPWLIFGRFLKSDNTYATDSRSIGLTIHAFPYMSVTITDKDLLDLFNIPSPITVTLTAPPKKISSFFDEGKEILRLFEKIYGPYPYQELHIAQMAPQLNFGQAPPGFLQLTGAAFMSQAQVESDFIHGFLSHEIAHQWWGNQVGWASDDDEWLSESFAEYAAGIFVKEYQGAKRFQRTLEEWRRGAKHSDAAGPIAAANTMSGPEGGRHRLFLLYYKGPYVLHMLRVQLDDEKYTAVMRRVQENFKHTDITTEMLLAQVNRVTGADFTYFFDQWIWDVGIPTFRYSWRSEKQPDGKHLVTVHVSQDDKTRVKKVLMPVHLHFKGKSIPQYKPVIQAEQDIKLLVPEEPKNVTLDDDRTLLAEIVKAS
jgi:hypothetical protein